MRLPPRGDRAADGDGLRDQDAVPAVLHGVGHVPVHGAVCHVECECQGDFCLRERGYSLGGCSVMFDRG